MPEGGKIRSAGEVARHAHDCNTVVLALHFRLRFWLGLHLRLRGGRIADFAEFLDQMAGETGDVRVVKYHGVGDHVLIGKCPVQAIPQLYRHQRIHPQIEKSHCGFRCCRQPQHCLYLLLQEGYKQVLGCRCRCLSQLGKQVL